MNLATVGDVERNREKKKASVTNEMESQIPYTDIGENENCKDHDQD